MSIRNRTVLTLAFGGLIAAALVVATPLAAQQDGAKPATAPASQSASDLRRWEAEVAAFEAWDRKNSPPKDAVLFVGSSSIANWQTALSFPEWTVINRGIGGTHISNVTQFAERIVKPYKPRVIVLYAGDNDVSAGKTPQQVCDDFGNFVRQVRGYFPDVPIVYLSIKPSKWRWEFWPAMKEANAKIAEKCRPGQRLTFVDVSSALLDANGQPRDDLFMPDKLHLNKDGYAAWSKLITPVVQGLIADGRH